MNRIADWIGRFVWARWVCPHTVRRCIHGDEINAVGGRRSQCLSCGRYLPELPEVCSTTGGPH